jgi:hypothetical protein
MNSTIFKGFYLNNNEKLTCYGLGIIKYNDYSKFVIGSSEIDTCIKEIIKPTSYFDLDIGIINRRDLTNSFKVVISTYTSLFMLTCVVCGSYFIIKKFVK